MAGRDRWGYRQSGAASKTRRSQIDFGVRRERAGKALARVIASLESVEVARARRQHLDHQPGKSRLGSVRVARAAIDADIRAANLARTGLDAAVSGERPTAASPGLPRNSPIRLTTMSSWTFFAPAIISAAGRPRVRSAPPGLLAKRRILRLSCLEEPARPSPSHPIASGSRPGLYSGNERMSSPLFALGSGDPFALFPAPARVCRRLVYEGPRSAARDSTA